MKRRVEAEVRRMRKALRGVRAARSSYVAGSIIWAEDALNAADLLAREALARKGGKRD